MAVDDLYGAWKLLSLRFIVTGTGETADMYGADPLGYLIVTPENRMMTVVTSRNRTPEDGEAALFSTMMAYSGAVRVDGDLFITDVEVSWHPAWLGSEQARTFRVDGDVLSITTAEVLHPLFPERKGRGVLRWQRA